MFSQLQGLNSKIVNITDVENMEDEIFSAEEFTIDTEIAIQRLRAYRDSMNTRAGQVIENNSARLLLPEEATSNVTVSTYSSNTSQFHKLPKLTLPTFDGDILKWQTFWDSFESTVHNNASLTDIQRFSYLKLKKPA